MRRSPLLPVLLILAACDGSRPAAEVMLPVVADPASLVAVTTDLGWAVDVKALRLAVSDVQFTTGGEMHTSLLDRARALVEGTARAHPGHSGGGQITGELAGSRVLDFRAASTAPVGVARLIAGQYQGMNLAFHVASVADGIAADDPLLGHAAHLAITATKGDRAIRLTAAIDLDEGALLVGAPFVYLAEAGATGTIRVRLFARDPASTATLFDGVDFAALDADGDGEVAIGPGQDDHNRLRRALQVHDYYAADASPAN